MRPLALVDVGVLLTLGLVLNVIFYGGPFSPDFLLAAFAVIVLPARRSKYALVSGMAALIFTVFFSWFSLPMILQVFTAGVVMYLAATVIQKYIKLQSVGTLVISLLGTLAGVGIGLLIGDSVHSDLYYWALTTTALAYTFYLSIDFSERLMGQYRTG